MSTLKYAIIGAGMMGREHMTNIALLPEAEVVALCDTTPSSITDSKDIKADVESFECHKALIAADIADVYVVVSPNHTHIDVMKDLLKTDKHILCEKPLCTTVADCQTLYKMELARRERCPKAITWIAMEYRYMPPVTKMIERVAAGDVGQAQMIAIREHRFPFLKKIGDWNRFSANTGGTLVEKCCHFFDLMRLLAKQQNADAEIVGVYASGNQDVNHLDETYAQGTPDILDNAYVVADFNTGQRAVLDLCMFAEISKDQEEIAVTGDKGKIEIGIPSSTYIFGDRASENLDTNHMPVDETILNAGSHHGSTYYQHRRFLDAILNGTKPEVSFEDGMVAVAIGQAAHLSISEKRRVEISEIMA